jgi:uncharacterized membrane protein
VPQPPDIFLFLGRFHPLLVHLPIGMLVALALLELAAFIPRFKNANVSAGYIIALAAPLALMSATCGWLLSLSGGYDATLLAWHKWLGITTAVGSVTAAILFWRKKFNSYRIVLFISVTVLMVAGHLGGSLTHGSDYLGRYAPRPFRKLLGATEKKNFIGGDISQAPVFAAVIEPILETRCVECHGPAKVKAELRLDSFAGLMKGGEDGGVVKPGDIAQSPLMQRVLLPADSDDHMPPAGKPQLSANQIAVLKWWVEAGAPEQKTLAELQPPPEISKIISTFGISTK